MKKFLLILLVVFGLVGVGISAWAVSSTISRTSTIVEPSVSFDLSDNVN